PLAFTMVGLKLVLHPFIVWLLVDHVFRLDSPWSDVAIVLAAMPTGINAYLFAARYQSGEAEAASAVLISTALSLVSVSVILTLRLG
ncbi:MAG: AEC family transporter, partial [Geminicoccaceae bacterium]|nr:AEC family transporter [Geminicoccaceae bacterium]